MGRRNRAGLVGAGYIVGGGAMVDAGAGWRCHDQRHHGRWVACRIDCRSFFGCALLLLAVALISSM